MDPIIGGALINAGSSLIGGLLGGSDQPQFSYHDTRQAAEASIRGRMNMAKEYGISPLYMLGASTTSPVMSGGGGTDWGQTLSNMGADVSRAFAAKQTDAERVLQGLALDKAGLENDYLREQIRSIRNRTQRESAPPLPIAAKPGLIPEKLEDPTRTKGLNAGLGYETNPYFSDAQPFLNRYGDSEPLAWLLNLGIGGADMYWNNRQNMDDYISWYNQMLNAFGEGSTKRGMSIR